VYILWEVAISTMSDVAIHTNYGTRSQVSDEKPSCTAASFRNTGTPLAQATSTLCMSSSVCNSPHTPHVHALRLRAIVMPPTLALLAPTDVHHWAQGEW